ncbi:MerR family transcriptional regulator [Cytobacillus sp. IB215316]|uniref:MerR family transcriptional regulator n=1 Tax=Cytobacillus sp. IB215316 TaxID=3097354 RepID=UPI002A14FD61|nr:MerR family transcriptional regulator [Cytobacillus sp. IB215316]MDX8361753.1 MerR family transcriptional regulator [Cytobacillus sp. IB215316]
MKIGELSNITGVSERSIRYYEKQGLITPIRLANGYREYNQSAIEQVNTIQLYINLGLTTKQISSFLTCVLKNNEEFCRDVLPIYKDKLQEINNQIKQLEMIKSNLEERILYFTTGHEEKGKHGSC